MVLCCAHLTAQRFRRATIDSMQRHHAGRSQEGMTQKSTSLKLADHVPADGMGPNPSLRYVRTGKMNLYSNTKLSLQFETLPRTQAHLTLLALPAVDVGTRHITPSYPLLPTAPNLAHSSISSGCFPKYCTVLTSRSSQSAPANPLPFSTWSHRPPQLCRALRPSTDSPTKYRLLVERKLPALTSY